MFLKSQDITLIDLTQHYYQQIFEEKLGRIFLLQMIYSFWREIVWM